MIDWDSCVLWLDSKYFSESYWWDRSKYRNNGVVHGAKFKSNAFYFDGNNDYVDCGDSLFNIQNEFSLVARIKSKTLSQNGNIIAKHPYGDTSKGYRLLERTTGLLRFVIYDGTAHVVNGTTAVDDNEWHFVVAVWDGSQMKIYVDNKLDCTPVDYSGTPVNTNYHLTIGAEDNGNQEHFKGYIGFGSWFNKGLSEEEIRILGDLTYRR